MTNTLTAEIFSVGTWNGDTYTAADLHEIAGNFARLRDEIRPPLKFGHDAGQTLTGQSDGDPALGWVSALWVDGDKLMATFSEVPQVVIDAVQAGRYRNVSAEVWHKLRHGDETLTHVLKAVALLGADLPAVTNLRDLTAYLTRDDAWQAERVLTFTRPLHAAFTLEEQPMTDTPTPQLALEAELEDLRAYKAQQEVAHQQAQRRKHAEAYHRARESALAFCEGQVRAGTLAPNLRDRVVRELDAQANHFTAGAGLHVPWPLVQSLLSDTTAAPLGSEVAHASDDVVDPGGDDPSAWLAALAHRKMVELNLGYSQAAQYVLKTNPGLARAYRDYTLNPQSGV